MVLVFHNPYPLSPPADRIRVHPCESVANFKTGVTEIFGRNRGKRGRPELHPLSRHSAREESVSPPGPFEPILRKFLATFAMAQFSRSLPMAIPHETLPFRLTEYHMRNTLRLDSIIPLSRNWGFV